MFRRFLASASLASLALAALAGCGNTPPSVDTFTMAAPVTDAAGNSTIRGTITVSDEDGDKIARLDISATGPTAVAVPSLVPPGGAAGTYPFELKIPAAAAKGDYTFSIVAYDEPGGASEAKKATVTLK